MKKSWNGYQLFYRDENFVIGHNPKNLDKPYVIWQIIAGRFFRAEYANNAVNAYLRLEERKKELYEKNFI